MRVVVVVPWRTDHGPRERAWEFVSDHISTLGLEVFDGDAPGRWSLAKAVNRLAAEAGEWDRLVVWTADNWVPTVQVEAAIEHARRGLVLAYDRTVRLDEPGTSQFIDAGTYDEDQVVRRRPVGKRRLPVGGVKVVPRRLWRRVRGFDERFVGWGGEDNAFYFACKTFAPVRHIEGELVSLWHPKSEPTLGLSRLLYRRYRNAAGDQRAMRRLIQER